MAKNNNKNRAAQGNRSSKKRSQQKILNAYEIAQRAEQGEGSDYEGSDDDRSHIINSRKFFRKDGEEEDDNDSFEDEEIDSDEAMGEDDFDVLDSRFSQNLRDKQSKRKLREKNKKRGVAQSDSESEEEEDTDLDETELVSLSELWDMDEKDKKNDIVLNDDSSEAESADGSEDDGESEDEEVEDDDEEDVFGGFSSDEDIELKNTVAGLKKPLERIRKKLINESTQESEFALPTNGKKLSLNEMMAAVDKSTANDAFLINGEEDSNKALAVPLPKRIQERHDRTVAYEITKEEVNKWQETVQANRKAEVLKFPMNPTVEHNTPSTFEADEKPQNALEQAVHNILAESSLLDEKKEATFEQIATAKMSQEELNKRTNELRLMRELMFREEKKARRLKKIKSKTFHKIKKREMMRNKDLMGEGEESDPEDHDLERAKERMNLKHNTQSKWAKSLIKSGLSKDATAREDLDQLNRLKGKILGKLEGEVSDRELSDIDDDEFSDEEEKRQKLGKGVLAMDFMKNAEARHKQENEKEVNFLRSMEDGEDIGELEEESNSINVSKNQGRRIYTPNAASLKESVNQSNQEVLDEIEIDNSKSLGNKLSTKFNKSKTLSKSADQDKEESEEESNPWLEASGNSRRSKKVSTIDRDSSKTDKAAAKINKSKRSASTVEQEDQIIDMNQTLKIVDVYGSDNEDDNEDESQVKMFKQKNLIKEAFAGDDVVVEFEQEKKQVVLDEGDKEEDLTLPGWGDWAGGNKKNKKKKIVKKIDGVVQANKRKDKNMKNVIINEKVNKKNLKYQSSDVPFPYESREQYERALRMPIGQEWTSKQTHQKLTMPRIIVKQGTVIDPLKAPFK